MAEQLQALLQALQGGSSSDAASQIVATMAEMLQQQQQQATYLHQQLLSVESRLQQTPPAPTIPLTPTASVSQHPMLVDTKTLGKVDKFRGAKKDWVDWSFGLKAFLGGVDARAVKLLNWAANETDEISETDLDLLDEPEAARALNGQV